MAADRTNDLITIVQEQFSQLPEGPKLIAADLNGDTQNFGALSEMLLKQGWVDAGMDPKACKQGVGMPTCHTNGEAKESRIDFIFLNPQLAPALEDCMVDMEDLIKTHRPLIVKLRMGRIQTTARTLEKTTDYSELIAQKIQHGIDDALGKTAQDDQDHGHDDSSKQPPKVDTGRIRRDIVNGFHDEMDIQIEKRESRLHEAQQSSDTERYWMLITAAVEEAAINYFHLEGKYATKMRGRSKVTFKCVQRCLLHGAENAATDDEISFINAATKAMSNHTQQGNRAINIARRVIATTKISNDADRVRTNKAYNVATLDAYAKQAHKNLLALEAIKLTSFGAASDVAKAPTKAEATLKQHHQELCEMAALLEDIDIHNPIHSARLRRVGEQHLAKAKAHQAQIRTEAIRINREANSDTKGGKGIKKISRSIGDPAAKPLIFVKRDQDTADGGKKGDITTNPSEVDAIVKRWWKNIYDGIGGNIEKGIAAFFREFTRTMFQGPEYTLGDLDADTVYESFRNIPCSAGALDGWRPKELSYFSRKVCGRVAVLLNMIENGSPWPSSTLRAKVVFLEKAGAALGEVMSYRPLTITSPLYRAWGSMRLRHLAEWVDTWKLPEMFAGVPEMGAVDAWYGVLLRLEQLKLEGSDFCGGVADIAKFFDQIRRQVVYHIARMAGMPERVLNPYAAYLENLQLHNCLAGGVGTSHQRKCGIPQGCPFSMMMVALIMRSWISVMATCQVSCFILADDVLILSAGTNITDKFVKALNGTHRYLQMMGARVAPDKSFNFASKSLYTNWLKQTEWEHIGKKNIDVVKDFRYLGAHLSSRASLRSPTLDKRLDQAIQQLKRLKFCPATAEAKAHAIAAKIYSGALYGVEAAALGTAALVSLSTAVIDVFRSRNNIYRVDWFYATFFKDKKDLDPFGQVFTRRALQFRRAACKSSGTKARAQCILADYVRKQSIGSCGTGSSNDRSDRNQMPTWYHHRSQGDNSPPKEFYYPMDRKGDGITVPQHDSNCKAMGPIGLLIESIIWHGLKIDQHFCLWQDHEEPVSLLDTPYQSLQPQLSQMAARARTDAAYSNRKLWNAGLREIDAQATKISKHLNAEDTGYVRTATMGGGIGKADIAKINEDIDDQCNYCHNATSTANHIRWTCPAFDHIRKEVDPELASTHTRYLLSCLQCGVAPAIEIKADATFWGQDFLDGTSAHVKRLLGQDLTLLTPG